MMITVILPDGKKKEYPPGITLSEIIHDFDSDSKEEVFAARVNSRLVDLNFTIIENATVEFLTFADPDGKSIYWHSSSHVMAQAVKQLFPEAKITIGPAIEDGFYYDFDVSKPFSPDDLISIEDRMQEIVKADLPFTRKELNKEKALEFFKKLGEDYKVEIINGISDGDGVSLYSQGDFIDLCRGPHLPSTGYIKAIKLLTVAGAYWRGDEHLPMLQRIYGTSYPDQKQLDKYIFRIEEAKKRDHRILGKDLDIFSMHQEVGAGLIHWHPKGSAIRNAIEKFWTEEHLRRGYDLVYTPHIASERIYQISGHLENYVENMYSSMDIDGFPYRLKPMNCPGHIMIFKTKTRSYRDLPMRYAELGTVYRYERSGVLLGMLRVRGFTQDDSHIFCTPDQLIDEVNGILDLVDFLMITFGYTYKVYLATRPERYLGSDEEWEQATNALQKALEKRNLDYEIDPGGGVFYAPKIDVKLFDALGREWQGPTIQVDLNLPNRFDINYVGSDGKEHRVAMVHRTVLGSMERFVGGLIEHYGGAFPLWLAPVQVMIMPVKEDNEAYAKKIAGELKSELVRVEIDRRSEKLAARIRNAATQKVPYIIVVGSKEMENQTLSVRKHGEGDLGTFTIDQFLSRILTEISKKR